MDWSRKVRGAGSIHDYSYLDCSKNWAKGAHGLGLDQAKEPHAVPLKVKLGAGIRVLHQAKLAAIKCHRSAQEKIRAADILKVCSLQKRLAVEKVDDLQRPIFKMAAWAEVGQLPCFLDYVFSFYVFR